MEPMPVSDTCRLRAPRNVTTMTGWATLATSSASSVCCPCPSLGYWLMREIYQYNQQMGITLMGGFLSWLFILQAMLIGVPLPRIQLLFLDGITHRIPGSEGQYRKKPIMAMLIILLMCLAVWMTPHSRGQSRRGAEDGRDHHPLLGVFGVMSAK